jgi:ABC-type Zn uptake system ZnuABC Zn-binding protein ZnuA
MFRFRGAASWLAAVTFMLAVVLPGARPATAAGLQVLATTTLLASLAADVGRGRATVTSLMPVGASPETFSPAPADLIRIHEAELIVQNGAGLEAWLVPLLGSTRARVVNCTDGLAVIDANPHLWLDPTFAMHYVDAMRDGMIAADPAGAATYRANAAQLRARLAILRAQIAQQIATIPVANRNMIVFHNAWLYFNARFGLRTLGEIEEIPGSEPNARHLAALIDAARAAKVRAIFAEPEYNPKLVNAVARSAGIPRVAVLYDDSVGTSPQTRDYIAMLETDTATIVAALQ